MNTTAIIDDTRIRRTERAALADVTTTLAAAFQDDPVFAWCIPDGDRRRQVLPAFFALVGNAIAVYDDIHHTTGGAAMWVPAGLPVVPEDAGEAFQEGLAELLGPDAERSFELVATLDEHHPDSAHHYLWFLGVTPTRQGHGIGSRLLRHGLAGTEHASTPAYLEATNRDNVRLYERHGFTIVDELRAADSPTLWAMWRPARQG